MGDNVAEIYHQLGFIQPTLIQQQTFSPLLAGENILGLAPTGSGKTLAYVVPLLSKTSTQAGTQLLVITASQELTAQVTEVIRKCLLNLQLPLQVTSLGGGANLKRQQEKLKRHPEIVVGTPGRMLELAENKKLKLHKLKFAILDEADDLLADEKLSVCRRLLSHAPAKIQLGFFSATDNPILHELPRWFNQQVKRVDVRQSDQTQGQVAHYYVTLPTRKRFDLLRKLGRETGFKGLVFFNQVADLEKIAQRLEFNQVAVATLDSQQRQTQRQQAIRNFTTGETALLLATDVAARGLDLPALPVVINYDLPLTLTAYIHRVGRTGRMGNSGTVINLGNERSLRQLKQLLRPAGYQLELAKMYYGQVMPLTAIPASLTPTKQSASKAKSERLKKTVRPTIKKRSKKKHKQRWRDQKNKGKHKL
ncbi:DEAD/DEAH box helicase [Liquorilactobacillus vini]|uniref:ATP-dependent RNA helicase n=1 Tax=Liquorilactobacillus vini DSM 20605 TaxID=1133569 RepID=A0A0R2C9I3_9LACO|nr:DEAD/DEAH box helicase [Liquorilactobacillus vini]KRM88461.1 ATP-dependent RNA helicase [Liquorilactobacillus vini DSM 20605]